MFRQDFQLKPGPGLTVEKVPKIIFSQNDGPEEIAEWYSLAEAACADFRILAFDVRLGLGD
jgi:hypothetical protein